MVSNGHPHVRASYAAEISRVPRTPGPGPRGQVAAPWVKKTCSDKRRAALARYTCGLPDVSCERLRGVDHRVG